MHENIWFFGFRPEEVVVQNHYYSIIVLDEMQLKWLYWSFKTVYFLRKQPQKYSSMYKKKFLPQYLKKIRAKNFFFLATSSRDFLDVKLKNIRYSIYKPKKVKIRPRVQISNFIAISFRSYFCMIRNKEIIWSRIGINAKVINKPIFRFFL